MLNTLKQYHLPNEGFGNLFASESPSIYNMKTVTAFIVVQQNYLDYIRH